jgi:thiamine pyrophosphate-dependent acetolactate synthase large subunit-like protein
MLSDAERPLGDFPEHRRPEWGSDALAELLRRLEVPFIAINPGASYRGLHDSIVNYLGNDTPQLVLCLHEEHAVALAHGYAKVTGRPMAVALHSNVGLMHATMALFNAFCDRVPMLVLGATGPIDATERRPWIDWIHTSSDQAALVRNYIKWDDQPSSAQAAVDSVFRAYALSSSYPCAPSYVCLDAALQEGALASPPAFPDLDRHRPPAVPSPSSEDAERAFEMLARAERPLLLMGRVGRSTQAWEERIRLAETLGAVVLTDLKVAAAFPTAHNLHPATPGTFLTESGKELVQAADVILSLDWVDLGGTLRQAPTDARVISCTCDHALHNGWSKDHFELARADLAVTAHPDMLVRALLKRSSGSARAPSPPPATASSGPRPAPATADRAEISLRELAAAVNAALAGSDACLVRLPLGWDGADLVAEHPLDYLGQDGGAGLGSGPGMAVGAALALRDRDRLAVAVLGDGDFLMGASALWTAAHYGLPLLIVIANNRSFFNDEVHQERVAKRRGRPAENRWIGQHIRDPDPDLAGLARSLGVAGRGPVRDRQDLDAALAEALAEARAGTAVLIDVRVVMENYAAAGPAEADGARSG